MAVFGWKGRIIPQQGSGHSYASKDIGGILVFLLRYFNHAVRWSRLDVGDGKQHLRFGEKFSS